MNRWTWLALGGGAIAVALLVGRRKTSGDGAIVAEDEEALGRVITSEARGYSLDERTAIAWTVRNRARRRGVSIARLVCHPTCGPCCQGRPFSSARPSTTENRELARRVLAAPQSDDPTGGALAFFEPKVQDWLVAKGQPHYHLTSDKLRAKWRREGERQLATVGQFEFWT